MNRRYDIDALRVLAFALLIFYHTGMFFVPWGWHIKNPETYEWLSHPMLFLNRWRMPLLFLISGMGTAFSLGKRTARQFSLERLKVLLIPLIFGMLAIVPPQVYIERVANGDFSGLYFDFWPSQLFINGAYPEGNFSWHHLWFLPYILVYALLFLPFFLYIRRKPSNTFSRWTRALVSSQKRLYFFIVPLIIFEVFIDPFFPVTHALIDDWFNFIYSGFIYIMGFLLVSERKGFWQTLEKDWKGFLVTGIVTYSFFAWVRTYEDGWQRHVVEAILNQISMWSWILCFFALAARYLNHPYTWITYGNRAVYCFYILHQTVIIVLAYFLIKVQLSLGLKFGLIVFGTFAICFVLYEFVIRRFGILRTLFGVRAQ